MTKRGKRWLIAGILSGVLLVVAASVLVVRHAIGRRRFTLGYREMNIQRYEAAIAAFTTALQYPLGQQLRAYALGDRGYCRARKQRNAEALSDFDAALRLDQRLGFAYAERSRLRLGAGDTTGAWDDASRAITLDPNAAIALFTRATISRTRRQWDDAIRDYSEAIRAYPNYPEAYVHRAWAYERKNDAEHALASLDAAIRTAPRYTEAYVQRGYYYEHENEPEKALADFSEALKIAPQSMEVLLARARLLAGRNELAKAIADYSSILQMKPIDEAALSERAVVYTWNGEYDRGIQDYTELIRITQSRGAYERRAGAALHAGKYQDALADYQTAAKLGGGDPTAKRLPWLLATCPDATFRNGAEALRLALEDCERTGWKSWNCLDTAAAASAETGDFKQAIAYEQQALRFARFNGKRRELMEHRLALYKLGLPYRDAPRLR